MEIKELEKWINKQKEYAEKVLKDEKDEENIKRIKLIIDTYDFVLRKIKRKY